MACFVCDEFLFSDFTVKLSFPHDNNIASYVMLTRKHGHLFFSSPVTSFVAQYFMDARFIASSEH